MSLLTVREVAERLGVSRTFVLRRVRSGDMPGFRLGGDGPLRFDWDEVERWARDSAGKSSRTATARGASATTSVDAVDKMGLSKLVLRRVVTSERPFGT